MDEQVCDRELLGHKRILGVQFGENALDGCYSQDFALVNQDAHGTCDEGFGQRRDAVYGIGIRPKCIFHVTVAIVGGMNDRSSLCNAQRKAWRARDGADGLNGPIKCP